MAHQPNPYQPPVDSPQTVSPEPAEDIPERLPPPTMLAFTPDTLGNLRLCSRATKFASVACFLATTTPLLRFTALLRMYGMPNGWTTLHTIAALGLVFVPLWGMLGWQLWKYSSQLNDTVFLGASNIESLIERQTKVWVAVQLLLMAFLLFVATTFLYNTLVSRFSGQ